MQESNNKQVKTIKIIRKDVKTKTRQNRQLIIKVKQEMNKHNQNKETL